MYLTYYQNYWVGYVFVLDTFSLDDLLATVPKIVLRPLMYCYLPVAVLFLPHLLMVYS